MDTNKIRIGKFTESRIVHMFGTPKQIESYIQNKRFIGNNKKAVITRASRYCEIEEMEDKIYHIKQIYKYPIPKSFSKMNKSLYKYIAPLILNYLIAGHDEDHAITLTLGKWARQLKMTNHNYNLIKNNQDTVCEEWNYNKAIMYEFYDKADYAINYYIRKTLDYLKETHCVDWRSVTYLVEEISTNEVSIDEFGNVKTSIKLETRIATKEELGYYMQCVAVADDKAGITTNSERYYSDKAKIWYRVLTHELYKHKIKMMYDTYLVFYLHLNQCQFLLSCFENTDIKQLQELVPAAFTSHMVNNALKRKLEDPERYIVYEDEDYNNTYCGQFENLCDMVINPDMEYLGYRLKQKNKFNYQLKVGERNEI